VLPRLRRALPPNLAVYILIGSWAVVQILPVSIADPSFEPLRPRATLAFLCNATWLLLFSYQLFWIALVVIALYLLLLYQLVLRLRVNTVDAFATISEPGVWRQLVSQIAFSANASWVTVATLLQLQINLLESGWLPTADFTVALVAAAAAIASLAAYELADVLWAGIAAWALLTISVTQAGGTDWGCENAICPACASGVQAICTNGQPALLGWEATCAGYSGSAACLVAQSPEVFNASITATAAVFAALVAGVLRGVLRLCVVPAAPPAADAGVSDAA
jgi:hypothetical protein